MVPRHGTRSTRLDATSPYSEEERHVRSHHPSVQSARAPTPLSSAAERSARRCGRLCDRHAGRLERRGCRGPCRSGHGHQLRRARRRRHHQHRCHHHHRRRRHLRHDLADRLRHRRADRRQPRRRRRDPAGQARSRRRLQRRRRPRTGHRSGAGRSGRSGPDPWRLRQRHPRAEWCADPRRPGRPGRRVRLPGGLDPDHRIGVHRHDHQRRTHLCLQRLLAGRQLRDARICLRLRRHGPRLRLDLVGPRRRDRRATARADRRGDDDQQHDHEHRVRGRSVADHDDHTGHRAAHRPARRAAHRPARRAGVGPVAAPGVAPAAAPEVALRPPSPRAAAHRGSTGAWRSPDRTLVWHCWAARRCWPAPCS